MPFSRRAIPGAALLVALCATPGIAQPKGVQLRDFVNDYANVMDAGNRSRLEQRLKELERKTGAQLVVLTVDSTGGRDIYDYGTEVFRSAGPTGRGLGRKGENNGVLVVVAVKDRHYHIFTGEGVEDTLPDLYTDRVAQEYFIPNFKKGNYGQGIYDGTLAMAGRLAGETGQTLGSRGAPPANRRTRGGSAFFGCFWLLIIVVMFVAAASRRRRGGWGGRRRWGGGGLWDAMVIGSMLNSMGGRRGGGWSGGSSWGGGGGFSGGGFGGGGGGSFGGGGSGGSW